ncbi:ABC transporter substrate-binding protein [Nocardiopsis tropica]
MVVARREGNWRKATPATAVTAALALALAGCGEGSEAGGAEGREFTIAAQSGPSSLDPAQLNDGQGMFVWSGVFDTLLAQDPESGELIPHAAESWEYNEDGTVLTFVLREGMTYSDDTPVDAESVAAAMQRTMETPGPPQGKFTQVSEVEAVDDLTFEVRFDSFDAAFLSQMSLSAGVIGHPETLDGEQTATNPVGSGPFELDVDSSESGDSYVLRKRDDHWNAENVPVSTFTVEVIPDSTARFNALQSGQIDATNVESRLLEQLDEGTFTISEIEAHTVFTLMFLDRAGEEYPALGDQRVRQALNYAIDRDAIVDNLLFGSGVPTAQIFNPEGEVYDPELEDLYEYDPERGRELVEEAGYAGESFEVPSTYLTSQFESTLSQAFDDVGLQLEWQSVPPQQVQSALSSGEYPLFFQVAGLGSVPSDALSHFAPGGYSNPQDHTDEVLDGLFEEAHGIVQYEDAVPYYREINRHAVEQAFEVPIAFGSQTWAGQDGVTHSEVSGYPSTFMAFDFED